MPRGVVKTKEDEKKWQKAREIAEKAGKKDSWAYVMGIFKKMNPDRFSKIAISLMDRMIVGAKVFVDIHDNVKIKQQLRRKANKALRNVLKPTYFKDIPLDEIFDALNKSADLIVIDEDGEEWSGMLLGNDSYTTFNLGYHGKLVSNAELWLSWYRMPSGKFEIVGYLT